MPQSQQTLIQRATACLRAGRLHDAKALFTEISRAYPDTAEGHWGLGLVAANQQDANGAREHMQRAIELAPDNPSLYVELARLLVRTGQPAEAVGLLRNAVSRLPRAPRLKYELGLACKAAGHLDPARRSLLECLENRPGEAAILLHLGQVELALNLPDEAIEHARTAARSAPTHPELAAGLADLLFELGLLEESLDVLRHAAAAAPDAPRLQLLLAQALEDAGQRDQAAAKYERALELQPRWGDALGGLLRTSRERASQAHIDRAGELLDDRALPDAERAVLGYALGRCLEHAESYDEAFAAWETANLARRRLTGGLDRQAARAHVDIQIARYNPEVLAKPPGLEQADRTPVFIVGMPRSGTTLLEQMLAAHPDAFGYGELPTIARISRYLKAATRQPLPGTIETITDLYPPDALQQAADTYYRDLARRSEAGARFCVDKAPLNFYQAGLISLLFPHARIIVCTRDPRDVCLSIYSENFAPDQVFSTDLEDLIVFHRQHERLIRHWREALPDRIHEVNYETLVGDPETTLRATLEWLGMDWNEACLEFHQQAKPVLTPSRWQVRAPIYSSSIGRWRHYTAHIEPLLEAFGRD